MLAMYLKFHPSSSFEIIQMLVIIPKMQFLKELCKSHMLHISNMFYLVTFRSTSRMKILKGGVWFPISNFERKLFVTSVTHQLLSLMIELKNMNAWFP